ncbi:MAG: spore germination protein [Acetobacteraceae bacterium]|nr:spore germination protein [Acetobacteraceae bacterium]
MSEFRPWPPGSLTGAQYLALTMSGFMAMGLFEFPADLAQVAGRAALVSLLISIALTVGGAAALLALARRFPGRTVIEYAPMILGRWPGRAVIAALLLLHLFITGVATESFTRAVNNVVLPQTPAAAVALIYLATAVFLSWIGLVPLGSTCQVAFPAAWSIMMLVTLIAVRRVQGLHLLPSLVPGWGAVAQGVLRVYYPFMTCKVLYLLPGFIANRRRLNLALWAVGVNSATFLAQFLVTAGILGVDTLHVLTRPTAFMMRIVRFPGFLVEHVGYVVAISFTIFNCLFAAIQIWAISLLTAGLLNLPRDRYRLFIGPVAAAAFALGLAYEDEAQLSIQFTRIISPAGLVTGVLLPAVLYLVARLRGFKPPPATARQQEKPP